MKGSNINGLKMLPFSYTGHLYYNCPSLGKPNYDFEREKPPIDNSISMPMATANSSKGLPTDDVVILKPKE